MRAPSSDLITVHSHGGSGFVPGYVPHSAALGPGGRAPSTRTSGSNFEVLARRAQGRARRTLESAHSRIVRLPHRPVTAIAVDTGSASVRASPPSRHAGEAPHEAASGLYPPRAPGIGSSSVAAQFESQFSAASARPTASAAQTRPTTSTRSVSSLPPRPLLGRPRFFFSNPFFIVHFITASAELFAYHAKK